MSRPNFHINLNETSEPKEQVKSKCLGADEYDEETLMSFQEWRDAGFWVLKGSKARCVDAVGVHQFSKDQTTAANIEFDLPIESSNMHTQRVFIELNRHFDTVLFKHHPNHYEDDKYFPSTPY